MFAGCACCAEQPNNKVLTVDALTEKPPASSSEPAVTAEQPPLVQQVEPQADPPPEAHRSSPPATVPTVSAFDTRTPEPDPEQMQSIAEEPIDDSQPPTFKEFRLIAGKGNSDGIWGMDLDLLGGKALQVINIRQGCIQDYNRTAPPDEQLQRLDFITEVNTVQGDVQKLLKAIKLAKKLDMKVLRTTPYRVILQQDPGDDFKKALVHADRSTTLTFQEVPSSMEKWNAAHPNLKVRQYDRIVEVNGASENCAQMLERLEDSSLRMLILPAWRP